MSMGDGRDGDHSAPAHSPAGGTGPGNSKPAGPQGVGKTGASTPHADSPESRMPPAVAAFQVARRYVLAALVDAAVRNLETKAALFRNYLPPGKLRDLFDSQLGDLKQMYNFGQPPGSSAPNQPLIAAKLQTTVGWVSNNVANLLTSADGAHALPGSKPKLWEFKTEAEKKDSLISLDSLVSKVLDVAIAELAAELLAAGVAGTTENVLEDWALKALKKIADAVRSRGGSPAGDDDGKKPSSGSKTAAETHWVAVRLLALPDQAARPKWWPPRKVSDYPNEKFAADITSGHKEDSLDGSGFIRYGGIPAGTTRWQFTNFFAAIEDALKPAKAKPDAKSIGPSHQKPCCSTFKIKELTFTNGRRVEKDTMGDFPSPEWVDGRAAADQSPISYARGKKIALKAKFQVATAACQSEDVNIRGSAQFGSDAFEWNASLTVTPADTEVTVSLTSDASLANQVALIENEAADITWEADTCGQGWADAGKTRNVIYVTLADPVNTPNYWTLLDLSCRAAARQNTPNGVILNAFNPLKSRAINRKRDGAELTYWEPPGASKGKATATSTYELLKSANGYGQCGSWAEFLIDTYGVHGISGVNKILIVRTLDDWDKNDVGFLVKNWTFDHPPDSNAFDFTHWVPSQCRTGAYLPGQRNPKPPPAFFNHFIVQAAGQYWDPSYGAGPFPVQLFWENAAIDGLFRKAPERSALGDAATVATMTEDDLPPDGTLFQTGFDKNLNLTATILEFHQVQKS